MWKCGFVGARKLASGYVTCGSDEILDDLRLREPYSPSPGLRMLDVSLGA